MFCVIYKFHVRPEMETEFQTGWRQVTEALREESGALGSRLHRDEHGQWIAYAQWPDEQTWSDSATSSAEAERGRQLMRSSFVEGKSVETLYKLTVLDDLLVAVGPAGA